MPPRSARRRDNPLPSRHSYYQRRPMGGSKSSLALSNERGNYFWRAGWRTKTEIYTSQYVIGTREGNMSPSTLRQSRHPILFRIGLYVVNRLLNLPFMRMYRLEHGYTATPHEYKLYLAKKLDPYLKAQGGRCIGIFGAGEHTASCLAVMPYLKEHAACLIDNNQQLWGTERLGLPVRPPVDTNIHCDMVFLSTLVHQKIMRKQLLSLAFSGKVIAPGDTLTPEWFLYDHESDHLKKGIV